MNQLVEHNGHYSCDLDITKEQWLDLLKDDEIVGYAKETLLKIYYSPEHKNTCKGITDDGSPQSANSIIMNFGKRVGKKLNMTIFGTDGKQKYWPFPMKEGVDLPNGLFEWTLRDELVEAIKEWLILDLIKRYKDRFLNVQLGENGVAELYKWQLVTECKGKTDLEMIQNFKTKNIVDTVRVNQVLSDLLKENPEQLANAFAALKNNDITLNDRLSNFKKEMSNLCGDKFKMQANDERTAAAFLACWNPSEYTFYKDEIYQNYCKYIGEQTKNAGEKYPHYLELLKPLALAIIQDKELKDKFESETKGLIQSDLLIAQNILWQMKDMMKENGNDTKQYWWLVANPKKWSYSNISVGQEQDFDLRNERGNLRNVPQNFKDARCGDIVIGYETGDNHKIVAILKISKENDGKAIHVKKSENLETPIDFKPSKCPPELKHMQYMDKTRSTLCKLTVDEYNYIMSLIRAKNPEIPQNDNKGEREMYRKLLYNKKNLILQGAPGTGKTYNTAALALSICGVKNGDIFNVNENGKDIPYTMDFSNHSVVMKRYEQLHYDSKNNPDGQIAFCTFHQSMDYEDFVEGIKPKTEDGAITYDIEDGIFKKISDRALANYEDSLKTIDDLQKQKNIQEKIKDFLVTAQENGTEISTQLGYKFIITEISDKNVNLEIITEKTINGAQIKNSTRSISLTELTEILEKEIPINKVRDITNYFNRKISSRRDYYTFYIANEINKIKTKTVEVQKIELQNYVLIIDEINRGNVSKIFGELITLLEADKRLGGEHPIKVTLPYSKDEFGVPSNLYIIGTMNTTDRSVGNIDYAVRRRFAFVTLKSKREIVENKWGTDDCKAVRLFDAVKSFIEKNKYDMDIEDLMVGHSYFMANDDSELELKWQYEILPLLNEYIKDGILKGEPIKSDMAISEYIKEWNKSADNNE